MTKTQGGHWELIRDNSDTLYHYKTVSGNVILSLLVREDGGIETKKGRG